MHRWIARRLPDQRGSALDVGCGQGLLAWRLSHRFTRVVAIDVDERQVAATSARCAARGNVTVRRASFTDIDGRFDAITMIAVLYHLDLDDALDHVRRLLAPGARLLVIGLARPEGFFDGLREVLSILTNPLIGMILHPQPELVPSKPEPFAVRDPEFTLRELRSTLDRHLPGAGIRHRLGFRHTVEWTAPA